MKTQHKKLWLGLGALALVALAVPAHAGNTVNITVSINATKSVTVTQTAYDFGALAVNVSSVAASAITVTNDSGGLIETYRVQGSNAAPTTTGATWNLAAAPGSDEYALQAMFTTARPADNDTAWAANDNLTTSAQTCSVNQFGDEANAGQSGASVNPAATRNLWFRIKTPTIVSDTNEKQATVTLSVL